MPPKKKTTKKTNEATSSNDAADTNINDTNNNANDDATKKRKNTTTKARKGKKARKEKGDFPEATPNDEETAKREERLDEVWDAVSSSLKKFEKFVEDPKGIPWNFTEHATMFTKIYDLCTEPDCNYFETQLYDRYSAYLKSYLSERIYPILKGKSGEDMLAEIVHRWINYRDIFVKYCCRLFSYLDRFYVATASKRKLRDEGHYVFKTIIFDATKNDLRSIILRQITKDRNGEPIDKSTLKEALTIFMEMGLGVDDVYTNEFEVYAEAETKEYYRAESEKWLSQYNLPEYLVRAEERIKDEMNRLQTIFSINSQNKLMKICDIQLLSVPQQRLLEMEGSGLEVLIRDEKLEDLARLYRLMSRVEGGLQPVADIFRNYVTKQGLDMFNKQQQAVESEKDYNEFVKVLLKTYVTNLLAMHDRMNDLVLKPFQCSLIFQKALAEGFKDFANESFFKSGTKLETKTPQLFAFFCDDIIRRGAENLDETLDKIVRFVQFFKDKDIFIEEYRKQLAKRLLTPGSGDHDEDERNMISKLKWQYRGIGDLYKLEKMLADKAVAADMKQEFSNFLKQNNTTLNFDLNVQVLTMGTWPINVKETLRPPDELLYGQELFKKFYNSRNRKRTLTWAYSRDTIQILARFSKEKTLEASAYQAAILLLFNNAQEFTTEQLAVTTNLSKDMVMKTLASLSTAKLQILKRSGGTDADPKYVVNAEFSHQRNKIKLPTPRVTEEENEKTQAAVAGDRVCVLDAAIVRVMKTRKTMRIQDLIQETISQVAERFQPDPKVIKKRMESLMERDYLQRQADNPSVVEYLA